MLRDSKTRRWKKTCWQKYYITKRSLVHWCAATWNPLINKSIHLETQKKKGWTESYRDPVYEWRYKEMNKEMTLSISKLITACIHSLTVLCIQFHISNFISACMYIYLSKCLYLYLLMYFFNLVSTMHIVKMHFCFTPVIDPAHIWLFPCNFRSECHREKVCTRWRLILT